MMKYKLEKYSLSTCEVCGDKRANAGVNVFHRWNYRNTSYLFKSRNRNL